MVSDQEPPQVHIKHECQESGGRVARPLDVMFVRAVVRANDVDDEAGSDYGRRVSSRCYGHQRHVQAYAYDTGAGGGHHVLERLSKFGS